MRSFLPILPCLILGAVAAVVPDGKPIQATLDVPHQSATWSAPPHPDATDHLIFNGVSSLLQRWPNLIRRTGHNIVPATIPIGTILYHGTPNDSVPMIPEWLAFDFEHAYLFARGPTRRVMSLMTTRVLRLAYFDGSSAAKMTDDGVMDSQDIIIWGTPRSDKWIAERERITALCAWGIPLGLDGFVRMEFHFEVMLCDLADGLEVVTSLQTLPNGYRYPRSSSPGEFWRGPQPFAIADAPRRRPESTPDPPPPGWKGTLPKREFVFSQANLAGSWHDRSPGETRVRIDYAGVVTFYDPALSSLLDARRGRPSLSHRLVNISEADVQHVKAELADVFTRRTVEGSGVDWGSITRVVVERYSERLELLKYLLEPEALGNTTAQAAVVRIQLLTMLVPYITVDAVPTSDTANTSWAASIVDRCSTTHTSHLPADLLTPQEERIRGAVQGTLHEICRRLTLMWVDAFDVELQSADRTRMVLETLRKHTAELMAWLDWSVWVKCSPGCAVDELCYVATWPFPPGDDPYDLTPRCISRIDTFGSGRGGMI